MLDSRLTVLVIAVGGNVSQGILKALAKSTLPCRVVGSDISALQLGLYTVDRAYAGPWAHEAGFHDWLVRTCREEGVDAILSGAEPVLRVLARDKARIEAESGAACLVSDAAVMDIGDDKLHTCEWLEAQGLAFPHYAPAEDSEAAARLVATCGYPLVAKPRVGGGAEGVLEVADDRDLEYVCRRPGYLLQESLGDDDSEYTAGCFCDRDGAVRGTIVMWRKLLAGTTYRAVVEEAPEVRAEAERITAALGPMGPCNLQFRMAERGPICFEINPRFSGTAPMRAHFGFNEVEAALRHFVLGENEVCLPRVTHGVALRYWNEMYMAPEACEILRATGRLDAPLDYPLDVEDYGMRP